MLLGRIYSPFSSITLAVPHSIAAFPPSCCNPLQPLRPSRLADSRFWLGKRSAHRMFVRSHRVTDEAARIILVINNREYLSVRSESQTLIGRNELSYRWLPVLLWCLSFMQTSMKYTSRRSNTKSTSLSANTGNVYMNLIMCTLPDWRGRLKSLA